jgi:hypothetical protein
MIAAALAGFGPSVWLGYRFGLKCRKLPAWRYWVANAVGLLLGIVLATLAAQFSLTWLWVAALGVMTGTLWGLKYGLGKSAVVRAVTDRSPDSTNGS